MLLAFLTHEAEFLLITLDRTLFCTLDRTLFWKLGSRRVLTVTYLGYSVTAVLLIHTLPGQYEMFTESIS